MESFTMNGWRARPLLVVGGVLLEAVRGRHGRSWLATALIRQFGASWEAARREHRPNHTSQGWPWRPQPGNMWIRHYGGIIGALWGHYRDIIGALWGHHGIKRLMKEPSPSKIRGMSWRLVFKITVQAAHKRRAPVVASCQLVYLPG